MPRVIWAHGACYQLAVSDSDLMKDTSANLEVLCRCLNDIYTEFGTLPLGLHLQLDNTSRENKNQQTLQFAVMLVAKRVFRWMNRSFLITGHTHSGFDTTFSQLAVKLVLREFDTDLQVVELLGGFPEELGLATARQQAASCYKLNDVAPWADWAADVGIYFSNITGPDAPSYFRSGLRRDLGTAMPA